MHASLPVEDLVFPHGDLGDSNVIVDAKDLLYFIGLADRWMDIAFAYRNLSEDVSEKAADEFLASLGYADAPEKREFIMQLDELF